MIFHFPAKSTQAVENLSGYFTAVERFTGCVTSDLIFSLFPIMLRKSVKIGSESFFYSNEASSFTILIPTALIQEKKAFLLFIQSCGKICSRERYFVVDPMLFEEEEIPTFDELLDDLTDEQVRILSSHTEKVEFVPGETIFYENEPSNYIYIVQQGTVEISKMSDTSGEEYVPFVTLKPGNVFGEMSFLMNAQTSAAAVASDHVILYRINRNAFEDIIENHAPMACKIYDAICQILVYRLKRTDNKLVNLSAEQSTESDQPTLEAS